MPREHKRDPSFKNVPKFGVWLYYIMTNLIRSRYRKVLKAMQLKGNEIILDFGSGPGTFAKMMAKRIQPDGHLTCLDVSHPFLNRARKTLRKYDNVNFILGDIRESNIEPKSLDIITATWVLHHIPEDAREETIRCFHDSLKIGGKIFVIEFTRSGHGIPEEKILELFSTIGFTVKIITRKKLGSLFEFTKN
ncbi:MAG: class I SAM-dependent methyltransferase [Candidatus Heimdallarchaeota archaeon]